MESTLREISVKTISGEVKVLQVGAHVPVTEFKVKVMEAFSVPIDRQRLICQGKLLKDEHLISDYIKEDGQTVHLMVRADNMPPPSSNPAPNIPQPSMNAPLQLDQMLASMMGNLFQGGQIFSTGQVLLPPGPSNIPPMPPNIPPMSSSIPRMPPPPQSNPSQNLNQAGPRHPVEIALPFDHIHNIGLIVNELHGPGSGFPPPRMPQIPVQRNPLVLLGGFLYNYQFQLMRLLPFISRVADLIQRESLITDPNERAMLQQMGQSIGNAMNELALATSPVTGLLQNLQIGPGPGQFQLRVGNVPVASEVRSESVAPQVPSQVQFPFPFPMGMPQGPQAGPANMLTQFLPMLTQMLGGNQNMTLRELLNSLQMHDEEESLPMMEFFYNLNLNEIIGFASGNWEAIERQRPTVRTSLLRLMENDSIEGRMKIVHILLEYMQRQYAVPDQFAQAVSPDFSPINCMSEIGEKWLLKLVNLVMDYEGSGFSVEFKNTIELMIGNYSDEMSKHMQGGVNTVLQMIQIQLQNGMARLVPPEFSGLIGGAMGTIMNAYVTKAVTSYNQWFEAHRTEEEAKESDQKTPAASLLATWHSALEHDLQVPVVPQRPFSRSYLESDVFPVQTAAPSIQQMFFRNLENGFAAAGVNPVPTSAPQEVIQEFFHRFTEEVQLRIRNDQDFRHGRFEFLDRIRK